MNVRSPAVTSCRVTGPLFRSCARLHRRLGTRRAVDLERRDGERLVLRPGGTPPLDDRPVRARVADEVDDRAGRGAQTTVPAVSVTMLVPSSTDHHSVLPSGATVTAAKPGGLCTFLALSAVVSTALRRPPASWSSGCRVHSVSTPSSVRSVPRGERLGERREPEHGRAVFPAVDDVAGLRPDVPVVVVGDHRLPSAPVPAMRDGIQHAAVVGAPVTKRLGQRRAAFERVAQRGEVGAPSIVQAVVAEEHRRSPWLRAASAVR